MYSKFKFSQLPFRSKLKAMIDYREGLKETRSENDLPTIDECLIFCEDCEDDLLYDVNGNVIEE
jgi:hypothetical protein